MANIANNTWQISRQTSTINITANSTSVDFNMGIKLTNEMCCAKACVAIDASKYQTITLQYSLAISDGISSIYFGVFDSMTAQYYYNTQYDHGISPASSSGIDVTQITASSSQTITINIPSGTTGTKYVGFLFYGNTNSLNANVGWSVRKKVDITSLAAVEKGYTLAYDANGGSGAPGSVGNITSTTISSTIPTRTGYDFLGWSTSSNATSATYGAGNAISLSSNVTLYAVWRKKTYAVTYNANGGSGAPSTQYKTYGTSLTLSSTKPFKSDTLADSYAVTLNANGGTCSSSLLYAARTTSYTFSKWNTNSSGTGTSYNSGASYTTNAAMDLYAIYSSTTSTASVTLPTPVLDGYEFMGWSTSADDTSGITGKYTPTGNVVLYAIWRPMGLVYICDKLDGFGTYKVLIRDSSGWNQYVPYIYTHSGWEVYSG